MMCRPIKYKETGLEWCPQIPEHWEVKKLKYLLSQKLEYGANESAEQDDRDEPRYLRITDFDNNGILRSDTFKSLPYNIAEPFLLQEGDILFARSGATVGKTFLFSNYKGLACFAGYLIRARLNSEILPMFLYLYTKSGAYNSWKNSIFIQATIQNIGAEKYSLLAIPLPPLLEQQKIADYLDQKTTLIDSIISKKEKQIELYKEERTAVINRAVTKGLNPDVEMKDSGIEWLGTIPKHWEVKKLKYCAKIKTGRTPKIQGSNIDFFENGTFNWFTPSDFRENILRSSGRKINNLAIDNFDVDIYPSMSVYLIGIGATVGKISYCETTASCNQQINVIVFTDRIIPKFGYYYLLGQKDQILSLVDYTTLPILNQSKSKEIDFIYLENCIEQEQIVAYLDKETNRIDTLVSKTSKQITLLKEYKEALINEVVTGQRIID